MHSHQHNSTCREETGLQLLKFIIFSYSSHHTFKVDNFISSIFINPIRNVPLKFLVCGLSI